MKYILFEKSAVELMINNPALQSMEFPASEKFVNFLREKSDDFLLKDISHRCEKEGIIFCGKEATKTFLLFDLEKCKMMEKTDDSELLIVLQKTFRFAVRFWNRQAFTNCEKIFKNKTVIFPFPFSIGSAYRIVLERNPSDRRLNIRGINNCLLAYKYGEEGASSSENENPDLSIYRKGGESYLEHIQELRREIIEQKSKYESKADDSDSSIHVYLSNNMISSSEFKYMNYEKQVKNLTTTQSSIVNCQDMNSPIRIEGPAGTGKTAALVLRAIKLLSDAEKNDKELFITFFTHSKSTESIVTQMIAHLAKPDWLNLDNLQRINVTTLQGYCAAYVGIQDTQIIDLDASEAKTTEIDAKLEEKVLSNITEIEKLMDDLHVSNSLEKIWEIISISNKYIDETEPWKLAKSENEEDRKILVSVMVHLVENLRIVGTMLQAYMPETAEKILNTLNVENRQWEEIKNIHANSGMIEVPSKIEPLFARLDVKEEMEYLENLIKGNRK